MRERKKEAPPLADGTLYLVATPIGNLEDITLRAIRTLRECDVIAAEDTRHTGQLLQHLEIQKPLLSYFRFNEAKRSEEIIERLQQGQKVALVTDAGTPGISDPGQRVVRAAVAAGCRVETVPGPCAFAAGLTGSGLPTDEIHFVGFLPHKSGQRLKRLEQLKGVEATLVFYESPYRIEKLLDELGRIMPDRQVVLARELTKKFEEYLRGKPAELCERFKKRPAKGEFVVMIDNNAGRSELAAEGPEAGEEMDNSDARVGNHDNRAAVGSLYDHPIATVGALIFNSGGEVLMIRTHKWSNLWGIPGGKPKFGETSEEALRREVKEETNLEIDSIRFVLAQDCIHSTEFYRDAHFVLLNYTCRALDPKPLKLNDEAEEFQWVRPLDALALEINGPTRTLIEVVLGSQKLFLPSQT